MADFVGFEKVWGQLVVAFVVLGYNSSPWNPPKIGLVFSDKIDESTPFVSNLKKFGNKLASLNPHAYSLNAGLFWWNID